MSVITILYRRKCVETLVHSLNVFSNVVLFSRYKYSMNIICSAAFPNIKRFLSHRYVPTDSLSGFVLPEVLHKLILPNSIKF